MTSRLSQHAHQVLSFGDGTSASQGPAADPAIADADAMLFDIPVAPALFLAPTPGIFRRMVLVVSVVTNSASASDLFSDRFV